MQGGTGHATKKGPVLLGGRQKGLTAAGSLEFVQPCSSRTANWPNETAQPAARRNVTLGLSAEIGRRDGVKMTAALTTRTCSVFLERPKVTGGLQLLSQASALLRREETRGDSPKPAPKPLCFSFSRPPAPHCYFCLKVLGWQWLKLETHSVWN